MWKLALTLCAGLVLAAPAAAAPEPENPAQQTSCGLYLTATEAFSMKQAQGKKVLFMDVREPVEIMFTGFTDVVDVNVPYMLVNPSKMNPAKPVLAMEINPDFSFGIARALAERGLDKTAPSS